MPTVPGVAFRPYRPAPFAFTSINLSGGYFPGWGIPCSILIHQIPIILAIFLSTLPSPPPPAPPPPLPAAKARPHIQWMYFPKLPNVSQAAKASISAPTVLKPSPAPASAAKGLVYPGPQEIVSDPLEPTNNIQTLIQPALKNAPIIEPPLPLPNLVLKADAGLAPPPRPLPPPVKPPVEEQPKAAVVPPPPVPEPEPPPTVNVSNVVATAPLPLKPAQSPEFIASPPLPQTVTVNEETKPAPAKPEPDKGPDEAPKTETASANAEQPKQGEPALAAAVPTQGPDLDTVVALSPMPSDSAQPAKIPLGEARGRFTISPKPNLAGSQTEAPSTPGNASKTVVVGIEAPSAAAPTATGSSAPAGAPPASVTISFGPGPAIRDKAPAAGPVAGGASGSASGSAPAAAAAAKSAFGGITVTGGVNDTAGAGNTAPPAPSRRPLQTSYGVSVVSTESSGGGLPSFGLFSNHHIYTVYVDMRETENDSDPSWTLEVAVPQDPAVPGITAKNIAIGQGLVLPFPSLKKQPLFPPVLVQKHLRKMIIVYGLINIEGKMEQIAVKQTPDPALDEPVLAALAQWAFRPAARNGTPFAVRVLLGIPLWSRELAAPPRHVSISTTPPS